MDTPGPNGKTGRAPQRSKDVALDKAQEAAIAAVTRGLPVVYGCRIEQDGYNKLIVHMMKDLQITVCGNEIIVRKKEVGNVVQTA